MPFTDRRDAGRALARLLESHRGRDVLVLGLPRGGVPVAYEVARHLEAPLDVFVARKLGAPHNPEYGIGAIAPGGVRVVDERAVRALGVDHNDLDQLVADETQEMERRLLVYRGSRAPPEVRGRDVLLVDDGLATGVTALAAVRALKGMGARRVTLAVPVCAPDSADALRREADEVVCVESPRDFRAVGLWYDDFGQTSDEEVLSLLRKSTSGPAPRGPTEVLVPAHDGKHLHADLAVPPGAKGLVVFAHGSGSGRMSPRNRMVAQRLHERGIATLLMDLLTLEEERVDATTREFRFDIPLLAHRLVAAIDWVREERDLSRLPVALFGASTGAAAALIAAAERPQAVTAVVSRGGRPDLAGDALPDVEAPTLLVVGSRDEPVIGLNDAAAARLRAPHEVRLVPGATHLFEEEGALEAVSEMAAEWFLRSFGAGRRMEPERAREGR